MSLKKTESTKGSQESLQTEAQPLDPVAVAQALLKEISQSSTLQQLYSAAQRLVTRVVPSACLQVWVWDESKQCACRVFTHQPAGTSGGHHDWGFRLSKESSLEGVLRQGSREVRAEWVSKEALEDLACPGSKGLAYLRVPTSDGLPLLLTCCVPESMEGDYSQLREHLMLLAQAMMPAVERARRKTEHELLSRMASLDWQRYGRHDFFDLVAREVCTALDAEGCSIFCHEAGPEPQLRLIGTTGLFVPEEHRKLTRRELDELTYRAGEGLTGWILQTLRPVRLFDARDPVEHKEIDPAGAFKPFSRSAESPDAGDKSRPFLGIPIFAGEQKGRESLVGVIRLHGKKGGDFFLPSEQRHLEAVSRHLARSIVRWNAALDNVEALEYQKALVHIVGAIHAEDDLQSILSTITEQTKQLFKARAASVLLKVPDRDELVVKVDCTDREEALEEVRIGFDQGLCGYAATHKVPVLVPDVSQDERFYDLADRKEGLLAGVRSEASVPIIHRGEILGVLNVDSVRAGFFSPGDQPKAELLQILADYAAIAISRERIQQRRASLQANLMRSMEELTATHKTKGLAHQLKNLLAPITLELGNLIDEATDASNSVIRDLAKRVHENTKAVYDFTDKVLNVPTSDRPNLAQVYLNELVAGAAELLEPLATQKGIHMELKFASELRRPDAGSGRTVELDKLQIHLVLWNLIQNGIDASKAEGVIEIATEYHPPDGVAIVVRDHGQGIRKADIGKIFAEGFSTKLAGSGVGLPLSLKYVKGHGGRIDVETKWHKGSTFTVILPRLGWEEAK